MWYRKSCHGVPGRTHSGWRHTPGLTLGPRPPLGPPSHRLQRQRYIVTSTKAAFKHRAHCGTSGLEGPGRGHCSLFAHARKPMARVAFTDLLCSKRQSSHHRDLYCLPGTCILVWLRITFSLFYDVRVLPHQIAKKKLTAHELKMRSKLTITVIV
jgi:hypothetical protein